MQDPDIPPPEEGNTNGAVGGVRLDEAQVARWAAIVRNTRAFSPLPWITDTAPIRAGIREMAAEPRGGPDSRHPTRSSPPSLFPRRERTRLHACLRLWKTFFS